MSEIILVITQVNEVIYMYIHVHVHVIMYIHVHVHTVTDVVVDESS